MAFLGVEPVSFGVTLAEDLCDLGGGGIRLKATVIGEVGRASFELYPVICLTTEKKHGNPSQGNRAATGPLIARLGCLEGQPRLACCTSVHLDYPGDFSQPSVGTGASRVAVLRGSPHQLTSSRNSRSML
jgi:hypothetical protein